MRHLRPGARERDAVGTAAGQGLRFVRFARAALGADFAAAAAWFSDWRAHSVKPTPFASAARCQAERSSSVARIPTVRDGFPLGSRGLPPIAPGHFVPRASTGETSSRSSLDPAKGVRDAHPRSFAGKRRSAPWRSSPIQ